MGGFGSGDWPDLVGRKTAVEQCLCLNIKSLRLSGFLAVGATGVIEWSNAADEVIGKASLEMLGRDDGLRLKVSDYYIDLERTACNYGGVRYWFLCPVSVDGVYCGSRCEKLYIPPGGTYLGCRKCYDLSYLSMQEKHNYDRTLGHMDKLSLEDLTITQALRLGGL